MSTKEIVAELERFNDAELTRFVDELEKHGELAEDLYDLLAFRMRAQEPARPFEEFVSELDAKKVSMAYQLRIRRSAEKEIADLRPELRQRLIERIRALAETPRPPGCKKLSGQDHAWRIRIGNYRVVYEINDSAAYIEIRAVAHRREVYR